jgi:glutamine synthetase
MEKDLSPAASVTDWTDFQKAHPTVSALDAFIIDVNGNALGKRVPIEDAPKIFDDGVQFSACALIADSRGLGHNVQGMGTSDGDPDGTALPIRGTLCLAPWSQVTVAQVMCHMRDVDLQQSLWFDPRVILASVVDQCRAAGIHPVVACELEFYLIDPRRTADGGIALAAPAPNAGPPRRAANLSLEAVETNATFLSRIDAAAAAQGVPVCGAVAEYGIGQYEVNLRHTADPLAAADHAVLLKRIVKGVAQSMGMQATFMAKPFAQQPGSGLHVHVSVVDEDGDNRFGAAGGEVLLQQAIAGMQAMMYESVGLCAPNFASPLSRAVRSYHARLGPQQSKRRLPRAGRTRIGAARRTPRSRRRCQPAPGHGRHSGRRAARNDQRTAGHQARGRPGQIADRA